MIWRLSQLSFDTISSCLQQFIHATSCCLHVGESNYQSQLISFFCEMKIWWTIYLYFLFASAVLKSSNLKAKRTWMRCKKKCIYVSICKCWRFIIIDCLENKSWKLFLPKLFKFQICNLNLHCGFMLKLLCKIKIMFRNTLFLYKLLPN